MMLIFHMDAQDKQDSLMNNLFLFILYILYIHVNYLLNHSYSSSAVANHTSS